MTAVTIAAATVTIAAAAIVEIVLVAVKEGGGAAAGTDEGVDGAGVEAVVNGGGVRRLHAVETTSATAVERLITAVDAASGSGERSSWLLLDAGVGAGAGA